jgi:hypothetical protein
MRDVLQGISALWALAHRSAVSRYEASQFFVHLAEEGDRLSRPATPSFTPL